MKKEMKDSITKSLIEKMDKKVFCEKVAKKVVDDIKNSATKPLPGGVTLKIESNTSEPSEDYLTKAKFNRVAIYYITHVNDPLEVLFHDLDKAYEAYTTKDRVFHASIVEIINEYKDIALKQEVRPFVEVQVLREGNEKKVEGCQCIKRLERKDGVERVFEECLELYKRKNHDYSNKGESAFDKGYKKMGTKSLWLRLNDKFTRFESLLFSDDEAQVKDEKIEDTLLDLINYAAMGLAKLKGYN
jgi:hypothetical protein